MTDVLTLREALRASRESRAVLPDDAPELSVGLAFSASPVHLTTLLAGHAQLRRPDRRASVRTIPYGDLRAGLAELLADPPEATAVVVEWFDLDPRLGIRESATAAVAEVPDLLATVETRRAALVEALTALAAVSRVVVSLPLLPVSPVYRSPHGVVGVVEAALDRAVADLAADLQPVRGLTVVRAEPLTGVDVRSHAKTGFPYRIADAERLAQTLAGALFPRPPFKGVITDLDDTVWRGLVGEVGPEGVRWELATDAHDHALYQQYLAALAQRGILVAIASKNEQAVVEKALARDDMILPQAAYFPTLASWGPKSASVAEILQAWNIGAADVVFIDDSPLELAEVAAAFPEISTRRYPTGDADAVLALLDELTGLFPLREASAEDALRLQSIRARVAVEDAQASARSPREFLGELGGTVGLALGEAWQVPRVLELVNKTNQFNLNGRRWTEQEWAAARTAPGAVTAVIDYEDKFGRLGTIGVLAGTVEGETLGVDTWVLSCRAFSRGIEHHVLQALAGEVGVTEFRFDYEATARNDVLAGFLRSWDGDELSRLSATSVGASELIDIHHVRITTEETA